ncbi:outer membrane protein [Treponema primitia ZAS-2]|uniref:Outer membrane protein n=1 Tax=Treponema primitia (strain ATCC BAA-887 / DSM 12427 / ZAS-2) TaxID=545694 RepID=F5YHB6_TREPZ|nr:flagellar filament outer layer protein FlaA [Treponema primitia]AEF84950.1 outer membrane protein [Treponema primitia ZAS-2]
MKQGSFKAVCFVLLALIAINAAFGDENTINSTSVILESFDGDSEYDWKVMGSKFATKTDDASWPQSTVISAWPQALFGINREGKDLKSLGLWGRFDRQGFNWVDVYPVTKGGDEPAEIPIPGRIQYFDLWVWGSNLDYTIEAYFRDYQGVIHTLEMGHLNYQGWKDLQVRVPERIPQHKRVLPRLAALTFVKFRIWTPPWEQVADFRIYFDQFKIVTDTFESLFDGDELALPERVQELWNGNN